MKLKPNRDYSRYDYLTIAIKTDKPNEILSCYKDFCWEVIESADDDQFDDIIHVSFRRKHKIANKDRLQLLQVNMETALNKLGKICKNKHSKSAWLGIPLGICDCGLAIGGILLVQYAKSLLGLLGGIFAVLGSIVFLAILGIQIKKLFKTEIKNYIKFSDDIDREIAIICQEARQLVGEKV
ncbi:MAG: hypothetical protein RR248_02350 [Clostridia bacterium]